jgi:hypothetical protein
MTLEIQYITLDRQNNVDCLYRLIFSHPFPLDNWISKMYMHILKEKPIIQRTYNITVSKEGI